MRGVSPLDESDSDVYAAMGLTEEEGNDLCYDDGVWLYAVLPVKEHGERFADILTAIAHGANVHETLEAALDAARGVTA